MKLRGAKYVRNAGTQRTKTSVIPCSNAYLKSIAVKFYRICFQLLPAQFLPQDISTIPQYNILGRKQLLQSVLFSSSDNVIFIFFWYRYFLVCVIGDVFIWLCLYTIHKNQAQMGLLIGIITFSFVLFFYYLSTLRFLLCTLEILRKTYYSWKWPSTYFYVPLDNLKEVIIKRKMERHLRRDWLMGR